MSIAPSNDLTDDALAQSKPPFLRRVRIRGYKSIAFCDVTLEPLTILVGRNASGKSNFLDALGFLRDLMEMPATKAVNERRGWRTVHSRLIAAPFIEMEIESTFESLGMLWEADYSFCLEAVDQHQIRVRNERVSLNQSGRNSRLGFQVDEEGLARIGQLALNEDSIAEAPEQPSLHEYLEDLSFFKPRRNDRLLIGMIGAPPFVGFADTLRASCVYNFHLPAVRSHQPITASPVLECNGGNLGRALASLNEVEPRTHERIGRYLKAIVPGIANFHTQQYGDYETVRFILEAANGKAPLEFDASSMSDGTLRILASLVAAYQIVLPSGYPGFVGIEEPETALHPAAMRALVDALDEATLRTQILLTTHSADMLDNPTIQPKNVRVVQMIDGQTVIAPVDEASIEIVTRKLNTLGGLERENQLEPDLDDQERQRELARQPEERP